MSDERDPRSRVRHPILRLDVVDGEGRRASEQRVFCRLQRRSVEVATCRVCVHNEAITGPPDEAVTCLVELDARDVEPDPLGLHTAVGSVLSEGTVVLLARSPIRDALTYLRESGRRAVTVVAADHTVLGLVHEATFLARGGGPLPGEDVVRAMSSPLAIHERVPVRRALEVLAAAHLREMIVVDDQGVPLGVFRDVDGLRWLVRARDGG